MGKLEGKVALVTGGSAGIGFATAQAFIEEGAYVYITGRRQEALDQAIQRLGSRSCSVQGDVGKATDLDRCFEVIEQGHGRLDIVFANAGAAGFLPLSAINDEHFDGMFDTNVRGVIYTVQKAAPLLRDGGVVILNGSVAATRGLPMHSVYSATKAAVRSLARTWTAELQPSGIRVNVLSAGPTETEGIKGVFSTPAALNGWRENAEKLIPLGHVASAKEIARAAIFLASEDSRFVAGAELFVDGGMCQV
jgi:NAD(P)-dependent dehydrogenase (short-subunit alcohol dehydrogenase family)